MLTSLRALLCLTSILLQASVLAQTSFTKLAPELPIGVAPYQVVAADFNGDRRPDLVSINRESNTLTSYLNTPTGFQFVGSRALGGSPTSASAGDFNKDGKLDLLVTNFSSNTVTLLFGSGNGTFGSEATFGTVSGPYHCAAADIDGDCNLDVVVAGYNYGGFQVLLGDGVGGFSSGYLSGTGPQPSGICIDDFNEDGERDIAIVHNRQNNSILPGYITVALNNPNNLGRDFSYSVAGNPTVSTAGNEPIYASSGDYNCDGNRDLVTGNTVDGTLSLFLGNGNGSFQPQSVIPVGGRLQGVETADIDGNGTDDLVVSVAGSAPAMAVFLGAGNATFTRQTDIPLLDDPILAGLADFNGDGLLDIAVGGVPKVPSAQSLVEVFLQNNSRTPTYTTVTTLTGMVGQKKALTARLRKTGSNIALANQTITFKVDGLVVGTGTTNASGVATLVYTLPETIGTQTIAASFAGDVANAPSTGTGTLTVTFANTVITVTDKTTQAGASTSLMATLKRVGDGAIAGKDLTFKLDGTVVGTATTNASGVATLAITAPSEVGSKTITVEYAGNAVYGASSGTGTLTLVGDTFVTVTDVTGMAGERKTLVARLRGVGNNLGIGGKTLTFKVDGAVVGTGVTSASGVASLVYTLPESLGSKTITVEFVGDALSSASTGSGTLTITFANTVITVANKSLAAGDTGTLSATLKRVGDGGIAGQVLTFKVEGAVVGTGTTNTAGVASVSYTAPLEVGSKPITVEFAGNTVYGSSVGTGTLTLTKSATTLALTNRVVRVNRGTFVTARLRRVSDGAYVSGASVTVSVNGVELGTFTTDGSGSVSVPYTPLLTGVLSLSASFAGDGVHLASSATGTLTVNP